MSNIDRFFLGVFLTLILLQLIHIRADLKVHANRIEAAANRK